MVLADTPRPGQLGFQDPATENAFASGELHDWIMFHLVLVVILVYVLVAYILICHWEQSESKSFEANQYSQSSLDDNKAAKAHLQRIGDYVERSKAAVIENALLEFIWTVVPVLLLLSVGVPSISLIYGLEESLRVAELVVRFTGRQWYWVYSYPTLGVIGDPQSLVEVEATLRETLDPVFGAQGVRLLDSTPLVLPVETQIRVLVTGEDVIHSMTFPSVGIKVDAVPGRLNGSEFLLETCTVFHGQCSEICGAGHSMMPMTLLSGNRELVTLFLLEQTEALVFYLDAF